MNLDSLFKITFAVHRVAAALPEEAALGPLLKTTADAFLANTILSDTRNPVSSELRQRFLAAALEDAEKLQEYFDQGKEQNWISQQNFLLLETEYQKVKQFLEELHAQNPVSAEQESSAQNNPFYNVQPTRTLVAHSSSESRKAISVSSDLSMRQKRILELLKHKERAQVQELQRIMPEVTKRTLRRDLDNLLRQNLIERVGEWNAIAYKIK